MLTFLKNFFMRRNRKTKKIVKKFEDREMELVAARSVELVSELQKYNPEFAAELKKNVDALNDALSILKTEDIKEKQKLLSAFYDNHLLSNNAETDKTLKDYYKLLGIEP